MENLPSAFENDGFFETVLDDVTGKVLGTRHGLKNTDNRLTGYSGQRKETLTAPFILTRGHKTITVKASPEQPMKVTTYLFPQSGRISWQHPMDKK